MKKIFYLVVLACLFVVIQSCKKDMGAVTRQVVIDTTLASGTEYQLNLQPYGDKDDVASIVKQATGYTISEITGTSAAFAPVYHYSAITKTGLSDQVILSVTEGSRGNRNCGRSDSTVITINFTLK